MAYRIYSRKKQRAHARARRQRRVEREKSSQETERSII